MTKHWVSYLLVVLIAFQSVPAIADEHQSHQSGVDHLEFDHDHSSNSVDQKPLQTAQNSFAGSTPDDCHHCCHCHVVCHLFISNNQQDLAFTERALKLRNSPVTYLSNVGFPNFRPPIT